MRKMVLPACWFVSVVFAGIATSVMKDTKLKNAVADAKERMASGVFTETDITILSIAHGDCEEYKVLFEGIRDSLQLKKANEIIAKQKKELLALRALTDDVESLRMSYKNSLNAHRESLAAANRLIEAYKAKDAAIAENVVAKAANYSSAVPTYKPTQTPAITKTRQKPTPAPNWRMPTRNQALAIVKKEASEEWGTNFQMVEHVINGQMEAYDKLVQYQKQNWKPLMRTLINDAAKDWDRNYLMMLHVIESQIEAKERLDGTR